jgi:hypothetical protein
LNDLDTFLAICIRSGFGFVAVQELKLRRLLSEVARCMFASQHDRSSALFLRLF